MNIIESRHVELDGTVTGGATLKMASCEGLDAEGYFHPHEADITSRVRRGGVSVDLCAECAKVSS